MNNMLITLLRLSAFGSVLIGILFLVKPLIKNTVSKAFSYYIWVVVLLRLCLPFGVSLSVPAGWFSSETAELSAAPPEATSAVSGVGSVGLNDPWTPIDDQPPEEQLGAAAHASSDQAQISADAGTPTAGGILPAAVAELTNPGTLLMIWAVGALLCAAWYVLGYIRFVGIIRRTATEPDDTDLAVFYSFPESGRIRFVRSAFVRTPMLIGMLHPTVVVPSIAYARSGKADHLRDILAHELTHYRRRDMLYKWFSMIVTSLHWFNPLMIPLRREISHACELSCDEAVIRSLTPKQKQHYGETLLSLAVSHALPMGILATTMCEEKAQLKDRLVSIMRHKARTPTAVLLSLVLLLGLAGCAMVNGIGQEAIASPEDSVASSQDSVTLFEKYGLTIAIPNAYIDRLLVFTDPEHEWYEGRSLISVYEKQSYEESRADYGGEGGGGYLFGICRYTRAQYEAFLSADGSGLSFFAKDGTYYYGHTFATDVQFYRSGLESYEEDAFAPWTELSEQVDGILNDFISRNTLTAYSDSAFWSQEFTYTSEHLYVTYYPYYVYQSTAEAQGFTWQDKAYTLVLSQPAAQGNKGIWCVERWYDNAYGTLYYNFPSRDDSTDLTAAEYYARLQTACDDGHRPGLLDPVQAAMEFATEYFDHAPVLDSFAVINGTPAGNVLALCNQVFDDMGTLQAAVIASGGTQTAQDKQEMPNYYDMPFSSYTGSNLYPIIWLRTEQPLSSSGKVVYCRNAGETKMLTFYEQNSLLCVNTDGTKQWFKPAYPYDRSPYATMFSFYEEFSNDDNDTPRHNYSDVELQAANDAVYALFETGFKGCTLTALTYEPARSYEAAEEYLKNGRGSTNGSTIDNVLVLHGSFTTDGNQTVLNPNSTYDNYMFILVRESAAAAWSIDDGGY